MRARMLSCFLTLALLLSLLAGCGGGAQPQSPAPAETPSASQNAQPSAPVEPAEEAAAPAGEIAQPEPGAAGGGEHTPTPPKAEAVFSLSQVPAYSGDAYVAVNDNQPYFTQAEMTAASFETYSDLDALGRCGVAYANVGQDLMPTEKRESIGSVKPSGWKTARYDGLVDGNYLYNRCHLIGFQLTGENANAKNLITGTRYLNIDGMLPFENLVADYVKETGNHVLYRVTPVFEGDNLVAGGVLMEGLSVEDEGDGVCFCVYAYNVQPGIVIDYATGESSVAPESAGQSASAEEQGTVYILNTGTMKFHYPTCSSVASIQENNRQEFTGTREEALAQGYAPCGRCKP